MRGLDEWRVEGFPPRDDYYSPRAKSKAADGLQAQSTARSSAEAQEQVLRRAGLCLIGMDGRKYVWE
jgi:hypothetical protein